MSYATYESCTKCAGQAQPGAVALLKYLLLKYPYTKSLGIYNCRTIGGTSTLSNHACGCAIDLGVPMTSSGGPRADLVDPIVRFLGSISSTIGLTEQIYNRVRYSQAYPNGRYYGGASPHYDHIHMSIAKAKGLSLTFDQIVAVAGQPTQGDNDMAEHNHDLTVMPNWGKAIWDRFVAARVTTVADSWKRSATRIDLAWLWDYTIRPLTERVEALERNTPDSVTVDAVVDEVVRRLNNG